MNDNSNRVVEMSLHCPVCNNGNFENFEIISRYTSAEVADHFCPKERNVDRNIKLKNSIFKLWKQDTCEFVRCLNCGFGFGYPFIGGDEAFYALLHEQADYPKQRWEYTITLKDIIINARGNILDIGAGHGFFLEKIKTMELFALEGSPETRNVLKSKGIKVYSNISELESHFKNQFEFITMFQVLEHISDFNSIISYCGSIMKAEGNLVISVPDCDAMIRQEKYTLCPDYPPNHINKWTPNSLSMVLNEHGFEVNKVYFEPKGIKNFINGIYLRILFLSKRKNSIANFIYRIKNKKIRISFIVFYSIFLMPFLAIHYIELSKGGAFLIHSKKTS